jgi:hypothetical protein
MRIQFLKDISTAKIPLEYHNSKTIVIYREGYKLPNIKGAIYMDFEKYKSLYINIQPEVIVLVGLNRIFVPANRCELVFEYLQTMTSHIKKYSIDTSPFIGEPWRFWFHYSVVFGTFLGINYSYAIETDWQHWFYRDSEKCIIQNLKEDIKDTYSDLERLYTTFEFYEPDNNLMDYYHNVKEMTFDKFGTPKLIIQMMMKNLNNHLNIKSDLESYRSNEKILMPNLGIYKFIAEENKRRMDIYNQLIQK